MDIEQFVIGGAYVRVPVDADPVQRRILRDAAAARGLPCFSEPGPGPHSATAREIIAEHQRARGNHTTARIGAAEMLRDVEKIAGGSLLKGSGR